MSHGWHSAGFIVNVCAYGLYAAVVLGFCRLFERTDARLALCSALAGILGCAVGILQAAHHAPRGLNQLFFFAIFDVLIGWLIVISDCIPRLFGGLMIGAGIGWFIYLLPDARILAPYIAALGIVAEVALMLRLIIYDGVRVRSFRPAARSDR